MTSEAHLPALSRSVTFVRYVPGKRKSRMGWIIFIGLIAANELRGVYVLVEGLKALGWIA